MFLDGGVRRGTDVFKALALGASGIFVSIAILLLHIIFVKRTIIPVNHFMPSACIDKGKCIQKHFRTHFGSQKRI